MYTYVHTAVTVVIKYIMCKGHLTDIRLGADLLAQVVQAIVDDGPKLVSVRQRLHKRVKAVMNRLLKMIFLRHLHGDHVETIVKHLEEYC